MAFSLCVCVCVGGGGGGGCLCLSVCITAKFGNRGDRNIGRRPTRNLPGVPPSFSVCVVDGSNLQRTVDNILFVRQLRDDFPSMKRASVHSLRLSCVDNVSERYPEPRRGSTFTEKTFWGFGMPFQIVMACENLLSDSI